MQSVDQLLMTAATTLQQHHHYHHASQVWEVVVQRLEETLGSDDLLLAQILSDLAGCYVQGRLATAEVLLHRARRIIQTALGPAHPTLAGLWHNLALVSAAQGQGEKSRRYARNAHAILATHRIANTSQETNERRCSDGDYGKSGQ